MAANRIRALVCDEPGRLTATTRPRPEDKPGHLRLRIEAVGICGTDYHIYDGTQPYLAYPRVMGHELSARAMADSADGRVKRGDLVVVNPYLTCGTCHACTIGKPNCCENIAPRAISTRPTTSRRRRRRWSNSLPSGPTACAGPRLPKGRAR
jgi:threonine dehydrogenase-like Zn-dependent dehydrogenase